MSFRGAPRHAAAFLAAGLLTALLILAGCGARDSQTVAPKPNPIPTTQSTAERDNVKVVDAQGKLILRLKADKKGYKVYDGEGTLLARLKDFQDHIKAEDEGKTLFKMKRRGKKFKTWVAEDEERLVLFTFNQTDTGYELADGYGDLLYVVRAAKQGMEVVNAKDQVLGRLYPEQAGNRVVMEGTDGKKKMEMRGSISVFAASALALEGFDLPRRAALFAFLHQLEAGDIAEGI